MKEKKITRYANYLTSLDCKDLNYFTVYAPECALQSKILSEAYLHSWGNLDHLHKKSMMRIVKFTYNVPRTVTVVGATSVK